ncbi:hypothetical protein [Defluviimonas salinarum]|uniref:Uncharacterized protein n=1 Tax=Defluviimonas salinarum TaxID=2992147 RepID=A0ABT3J811_9RHOB|nr:hypothetical protein [Defluviimonas salinarum]MCW3783565.1 hypothetical protein [Defluviimonas salinarum]
MKAENPNRAYLLAFHEAVYRLAGERPHAGREEPAWPVDLFEIEREASRLTRVAESEFRPMAVGGVMLASAAQRDAADAFVAMIRSEGAQGIGILERLLADRGVAARHAYRTADRLIQKMRKSQMVEWKMGFGWDLGPASVAPQPDTGGAA